MIARRTVEERYVLTSAMVKDILMQGVGAIATFTWSRWGKPFFLTVSVIEYCGGEALDVFHQNETGERYRHRTELDWIPMHFGDRRYMWCPICSRHCTKLYCPWLGDVFACRTCWSLTYRWQQSRNAGFFRTFDRQRAIIEELGRPYLRAKRAKALMDEYAELREYQSVVGQQMLGAMQLQINRVQEREARF